MIDNPLDLCYNSSIRKGDVFLEQLCTTIAELLFASGEIETTRKMLSFLETQMVDETQCKCGRRTMEFFITIVLIVAKSIDFSLKLWYNRYIRKREDFYEV